MIDPKTILKRLSFIVYFSSLIIFPAFAEDATFLASDQLKPHQKTISRVEKYLSELTTIISDFTQVAPDGSIATGTFYLKRPGLMRWQYHPPTPILMVADSHELIFYDYELEQVTHIPLDSTLVGFLAQEKIRFSGSVGITTIENQNKVIRIQLAQKEKPSEGQLLLEFSDSPLQIRSMVVTDATQQKTTVSLQKARYGLPIDKELFVFKDPRRKRR